MATKNRRAFELKLGKLGITLFVSGMSLLLFGMFLMGIVVGKNLEAYPEQYSGGLVGIARERFAWLLPQKKGPPRPELGAGSDDASQEETFDLTFYKTLGEKQDKNQAAGDRVTKENQVKTENQVTTGAVVPETSVIPETKDKNRINGSQSGLSKGGRAAEAVSEHAEPKRPVSETSKSLADAGAAAQEGVFEVQAAAYRDAKQAEKIMNDLKQLGFTPRIVPKDIPKKGKWFRVIAGDFASRKEADAASLKITRKIAGVKCIIRYHETNRN
jgi:cell division septation protein DedD